MSSAVDTQADETRLTNNEISKMIEHIQDMNTPEHEQIFNILKEHSCRYTENLNGVFVNLAHVPHDVLKHIQSVIHFWQDQKNHIEQSEEQRLNIVNIKTGGEEEHCNVIHRSSTGTSASPQEEQESSGALFNESTVGQKKLTQKELQIIRGSTTKKKKIALNKGGKDILKQGGSALRVAKKCLASEEES